MSEDPDGYSDGLNLYASYSSVNGLDPYGLYEIDVHQFLTWYLARKAGLSKDKAKDLGLATQAPDKHGSVKDAMYDDGHYGFVIGRKEVLGKKGARRIFLCNSKNKTSIDITDKIALKYSGEFEFSKPTEVMSITKKGDVIKFSFEGPFSGNPVVKLKWADIKSFDVVPAKEEDSEKTNEKETEKNKSEDEKKDSAKSKDK